MKTPSLDELLGLWMKCRNFVDENRITCAETVYQVDRIAENSPEFVEAICAHVGYAEPEL